MTRPAASIVSARHRIAGLMLVVGLAVAAGNPGMAQMAQPVQPVTSQTLGSPDGAPEPRLIALPLSKAHLIELPEAVLDVIVADPEIMDVIVKTPTQVYLVARSIGDTNVFFVGEEGRIVEHVLVRVEIDLLAADAAIKELLPEANIQLKGVGSTIVIRGFVRSAAESASASSIASRFVEEETDVINMLRILSDQQVLLQVRIAEMQRNVIKNLSAVTNFNRRILDDGRGIQFTTTGGDAFTSGAGGSVTWNFLGLTASSFTSLERQGLVKTLAEPALTAISGETANFLAGGEFPVPSGVDSQGNLIVEFRDFGVSLSFTPIVLSSNLISLKILTEVSRQATENKLVLPFGTANQTVDVIGLSVRRAESTVNLPSGGSLMIAGLLQRDEFNQIDGVPWVKDLPVLGGLFRSPRFVRNETELVVLIRAFLVRPVTEGGQLALPTDGFIPASDFDLFVMGRLFKQYSKTDTPGELPTVRGPLGYIME